LCLVLVPKTWLGVPKTWFYRVLVPKTWLGVPKTWFYRVLVPKTWSGRAKDMAAPCHGAKYRVFVCQRH
jgi:hypothetical protein